MDRTLLDVNDDCLEGTFKYLSVHELADIASTCTRFRTIARDVFTRYHKSDCIEIYMENSEPNFGSLAYRRQTTAILRHFGDLLTKLKVTFFYCNGRHEFYNTFFFNILVKHCTDATFEKLELHNCISIQPDEIVDNAAALFRNVKELVLVGLQAFRFNATLLSDAKQLVRLTINNCYPVVKILENDYPQLQSLTLNRWVGDKYNIDIVAFLKRHPNVVELELNEGDNFDLSSIGECSWLRKLSVWDCPIGHVAAIAPLDQLTTLKFRIEIVSPVELLMATRSSHSFEEIFIAADRLQDRTELPAALVRFTNLKNLSVNTLDECDDMFLIGLYSLQKLRVLWIEAEVLSITSDGLVDLVRNLPDLEQISFHFLYNHLDRFDLLESTYKRICEIYRHRKQKLVITDFDIRSKRFTKEQRTEPFAGLDQHEFVEFVSLAIPDHNIFENVLKI